MKSEAAEAASTSGSLGMRDDAQPFRVPKTAELMARDLRSKIVRGELKDGDTLPAEGELVERYSVSRPTLREALRILESEGLLTVTRGSRGGPRIHPPDPRLAARHFGLVLQNCGTTLADIFGARLLIEPSCVHLVASTARKPAVAMLNKHIEQEREAIAAKDDVQIARASARFHRLAPARAEGARKARGADRGGRRRGRGGVLAQAPRKHRQADPRELRGRPADRSAGVASQAGHSAGCVLGKVLRITRLS